MNLQVIIHKTEYNLSKEICKLLKICKNMLMLNIYLKNHQNHHTSKIHLLSEDQSRSECIELTCIKFYNEQLFLLYINLFYSATTS